MPDFVSHFVRPVFLFLSGCQNFHASRPHFVLLALVPALEREAFQSVMLSDPSALCASHRLQGREVCGGAAGVSSANGNHLASCSGQMEARWEKSGGGTRQPGQCPSVSIFPLPWASPACEGWFLSHHLLWCPDRSRIQGPATQAMASPEEVTQSLER